MIRKVLFAGLPNTGKTTYIAALWYMLCNYEDSSSVKLGSLELGEDDYLNLISNCWMRYEPVPRTSQAKVNGEKVVINIIKNSNKEKIKLDIPDFSGETFKGHFDNREWEEEYIQTIQDLSGILLFINPCDDYNRPKLLVHTNELQNFFGIVENNDDVNFVPYDTSHTSNQVKLVDCLQFIEKYAKLDLPIKVSVIISLWDKVSEAYGEVDPKDWVEKHLPLLFQYLICNEQAFISNYFGISSQGGDYLHKDSLADLDPMHRVKVVEGDEIGNDIFRPILWITE